MRYILAIIALVIAGMAAIAIVNSSGTQDARQQAGPLGASIELTAELTRTQPASTSSPEWTPPTPDPTQVAKATTQEALIEWAKRTAQSMGEPSPSLVDVRETTFAGALKLLGLHPQPTDPPDNHPVYVLRMKGKFKPYHSIGAVDAPSVPGVMHMIIDAKTGYTLRIGYIESSDANP